MKPFDFHIHSHYSADGLAAPAQIVEEAEAKGMYAIAVTDHGAELSVGINPYSINAYLEELKNLQKESSIPLLIGFELNIVDRYGNIDLPEPLLSKIEFPIASIHYLREASAPQQLARSYLERAKMCIERFPVAALGHPFFLHRSLLPFLSREDIEEFLDLMADKRVTIEVNAKYNTPSPDFIKLCIHKGVKLSVGSDAHIAAEVGKVHGIFRRLSKLGVKEEDLVINEFVK